MTTPLHAQISGSFVSDGFARSIPLQSGYQEFELINITDIGSVAAATPVMKAKGTSLMLAGSAYVSTKTAGASTLALENTILVNGFTFVNDSASMLPGPLVATTAVSQANPAVVLTATTAGLIADNTVVRMINVANMQQISSIDFTIGSIAAGVSFDLKYLDSTAFALPGAGGFYRIIPFQPAYYPRRRFITGITQALNAVVTMSVTHGYTVGQQVRIVVPAAFGMTEMNGQLATIVAITTGATNTITLNIDSTGFTAFAFPATGVASAGVSFPLVVPVGEAATVPFQNLLDDATVNQDFRGIILGSAVQTIGKFYQWFARAGVNV